MIFLLIASIVWAISFGLIGRYLAGVDPNLVAAVRLVLSLLIFLPFLRLKGIERGRVVDLLFIGAVQYGLMYLLYIKSYEYLPAHQVALFTVFTPIYVTLINDITKKSFHVSFLVVALLAVLGTAVIKYSPGDLAGDLKGILLVQGSNICFAFGQIRYRSIMGGKSDAAVYALLYAGAVLVALAAALFTFEPGGLALSGSQLIVLFYLGIVPSGICFFLWNAGARKTNAGTLAVLNNAKVPLAVVFAVIITGARPDYPRLIIGAVIIILSLVLNEKIIKRTVGPVPSPGENE